jgi:hypothetical protein
MLIFLLYLGLITSIISFLYYVIIFFLFTIPDFYSIILSLIGIVVFLELIQLIKVVKNLVEDNTRKSKAIEDLNKRLNSMQRTYIHDENK